MREILEKIRKELDDKQAEDIVILDVSKITSIAEYFVIASADNERKVKAIANSLEKILNENGIETQVKEGLDSAKWILMDFEGIVVHIFDNEEREYYNLERIWKDAIRMDF